MNNTIGHAIDELIKLNGLFRKDLAAELNINGGTLTQIIRNERELSFLMAVRLLDYFDLSIDEFLSMLSMEEINRKELSAIKYYRKKELRMAEK